jgi:uncharacterized repeat protein (TIGR01451 family)
MNRRILVLLAAIIASLTLSAAPAEATIFQVIPADETETPNFGFEDDQALFAIGTSDFFGGRVCIVGASATPGDNLSCDSPAWGSPNQVLTVGTFIIPIESPTLQIGTYRLLGDNANPVGPDSISEPFTISACTSCDPRIGILAIASYKATARAMSPAVDPLCKGLNYFNRVAQIKAGAALSANVVASLPRFALTSVPVGGAFSFAAITLEVPTSMLDVYLALLGHVTCKTQQMYEDIALDPPDPDFGTVAQPVFGNLPETTDPVVTDLVRALDRQRAFGAVQLKAFERYQGAVAAGNDAGVLLQSQAIGDFGLAFRDELRSTARHLRAWAAQVDADPSFGPVTITDADVASIAPIEDRVRASGFNVAEIAQLESHGLTGAEIASVESEFRKHDITKVPTGVTLPALLRNAASVLEAQSFEVERFAREGFAVAARLAFNRPPVAAPDTVTTQQNTPASFNVLANDTDPDGDALAVTGASHGAHGAVACQPVGDCTYTPAPGYAGPDSFTYSISDGRGGSDSGTVSITVNSPENRPPVPVNDGLATRRDTAGTVNVLANDSDPDPGDVLIVTASTDGAHGTVTCGLAGACTYTPAAGFTGSDSFTYALSDGRGGTATGTVSVAVFEPATPVALVSISTNFNSPIGIDYHQPTNKVAVSVNFPSGLPLNFELIAEDGSHAPFSSVSGLTDEVKIATVRGSSCQGGFNVGELFTGTGVPGVIARIAPDGATVANPWVTLPDELGLMRGSLFQDRFCSFGGDLIAITTAGGVWRVTSAGAATRIAQLGAHLEGLTTVPNDPARYGPWAGKILAGAEGLARIYAIASDGTVTAYELGIAPEDIDIVPANENFFGVDFSAAEVKGAPASAFADKVGDVVVAQEVPGVLWHVRWNAAVGAFEVSELARVGQWEHVTFAPAGITPLPPTNQPPVAVEDALTTQENTAATLNVLANDSDPDPGDTLTVTGSTDGDHGTVSCTPAGNCTYAPAAGFTGSDSFRYTVSDGRGGADSATVAVTVMGINHPPFANSGSLETDEDVPADVTLVAGDADGDSLTYIIVVGPEHGQLSGAGATRTYTPAPDYFGPDSFTFKANDGTADSNIATVSITVNPVLDGGLAGTRLFAGSDNEEFTGQPTDRFAAVDVEGPVVKDLGLVSTAFPVNGIEATPAGTLWSGDPFSNLQREMTLDGLLLGSVTTPFPPGPCCKEDFAYDGNHIWRAFWPSTIGEYLPNGTPVREYAQDDVVGMAFVGSTLWITKWGAHQVGTFDPATNTFTPMFTTATNAGGLAYDPEYDILWVGRGGGTVEAWDLGTLTLIAGSAFRPFGNISNTIDGLAFRSSADLELSKGDDPDPATVGQQLTYALTLKNNGPDRAATPRITDPLPAGVGFVSASSGCAESSRVVTCTFASLAAGATASATIVVEPSEAGAVINEATASSSTPDPNASNNKATQTTSVVVSSKATSTTYSGGASTQYSDPVTLSGVLRDTSVDPNIGIAGRQLDFTLGTQSKSAGPTGANGTASTSLVVTQQPGSVTSIETAFAGDTSYLASSDSDPFTIAKEDCTLSYSGDVDVAPTAMTALAADLGEPDATRGDRSNKTVVFTVTGVVNTTPQIFAATTDTNGRASMLVPLASDVYAVGVVFSGDVFYKSCATSQDAVVTVEAAAAKVTGGGWTSISTGRTNFGFNAIPEAGGVWKGQFQLRSNNNKSKFHARSVSTLSSSGNSATWSGTGTWNGQANYAYVISVVDNGSSGPKKGDKISITITSPAGVVVYTTGGFQTLKGGNVTVH